MAVKRFENMGRLNLASSDHAIEFDATAYTKVAFAPRYQQDTASAWSTAVITYEKSIDGFVWSTLSTTSTAEGVTSDVDVSTARLVRARVSTAQSDAGYAFITIGGLVGDDL